MFNLTANSSFIILYFASVRDQGFLSSFSQEYFQISPNLDSVSPFSNTLFFPASPEMKFSLTISVKLFFRQSEHCSVLAFITLTCSVNVN